MAPIITILSSPIAVTYLPEWRIHSMISYVRWMCRWCIVLRLRVGGHARTRQTCGDTQCHDASTVAFLTHALTEGGNYRVRPQSLVGL